jgi:hypothetical protein
MKTLFATFAILANLLFATAAHAALYEVTMDGSKYQISGNEKQEVTLTDGRRASVQVTTLGDLFWVRIDGMKRLLPEGKTWEAALKDGGRVNVSVAPVKGDPKVFQGYGISFRYPSDMEITQKSSPEIATVQFEHDGVGMGLSLWLTETPTKEAMDRHQGLWGKEFYKMTASEGGRFPKNSLKPSRRSIGGVATDGLSITYFDDEFESLMESYVVPHNRRLLHIVIFTNNPERKAKHDALISLVLDSLK